MHLKCLGMLNIILIAILASEVWILLCRRSVYHCELGHPAIGPVKPSPFGFLHSQTTPVNKKHIFKQFGEEKLFRSISI